MMRSEFAAARRARAIRAALVYDAVQKMIAGVRVERDAADPSRVNVLIPLSPRSPAAPEPVRIHE